MTAILASLMLAAGAEPEPQKCLIEFRVTEIDPSASRAEQREKVSGEPRFVTHFGQTVVIRFGEVRLQPPGITEPGVGPLVSGADLEVVALLWPEGGFRLETRIQDGPRAMTDVAAGTKHRFRIGSTRTGVMRVEVLVTVCPPEK